MKTKIKTENYKNYTVLLTKTVAKSKDGQRLLEVSERVFCIIFK